MSDFVIGFITAVPFGTALGIAFEVAHGIYQKPWSELSEKEKKGRKNTIGAGMISLLIGIIIFFGRLML